MGCRNKPVTAVDDAMEAGDLSSSSDDLETEKGSTGDAGPEKQKDASQNKKPVANGEKRKTNTTITAGGASGREPQSLSGNDCWGTFKDFFSIFTEGFSMDVHEVAHHDEKTRSIHDNAEKFDDATEYTFTYLQVFTACVASFAHGSNDVGNSVGPYAAVFTIWSTGSVGSKAPVPIWILAFGGVAIVIGLGMLGYRVIQTMGV